MRKFEQATFNCIKNLGVIYAGVAQPGLECQSIQKGNTHNLEVVGSKPTPGIPPLFRNPINEFGVFFLGPLIQKEAF
ncbi:protein of unknown function [Candidatus Nitrosotalea okcheonensis]|uniref:Uncharacterized protein n=1 Tax=Candidatus Nitrosotalea okcheonensis TaxID=1903276 RepID=A0A2H1FFP3_9ARCH|nr:protein of unknown function [Candidatus Nitrosotalea okcheonensis]